MSFQRVSQIERTADCAPRRGRGGAFRRRQQGQARFNPAQQDLWLKIKPAEGGWTYLVIDGRTGDLKDQTFDLVKKRCWEKVRDALAT